MSVDLRVLITLADDAESEGLLGYSQALRSAASELASLQAQNVGGDEGRAPSAPPVVTLCGSSRFPDAFALANMHLTMEGCVVIGLSCFGHADQPTGAKFLTSDGGENSPLKQLLGQMHFRKIDISDAIYVVNPGGYVGSSTKREIEYARSKGKAVKWMFPEAAVRCGLERGPPSAPAELLEAAQ